MDSFLEDVLIEYVGFETDPSYFWNKLSKTINGTNTVLNDHPEIKEKVINATNILELPSGDYKSFDMIRKNLKTKKSDRALEINFELFLRLVIRFVYTVLLAKGKGIDIVMDENGRLRFTSCQLTEADKKRSEHEIKVFLETIGIVDAFINSQNLIELLKKPDIYVDFNNPRIQKNVLDNKVNPYICILNDKYNGLVLERELTAVPENKDMTLTPFTQKKTFYDLNTDLISNEEIFNDTKKHLIFIFQYLVNKFFNTMVEKYIHEKGLQPNDVVFMYKGGTSMKILFEKYKCLIDPFSKDKFFELMGEKFKRSDSDYNMFISDRFDRKTYTEHYYNLNILITNVLEKIKLFIRQNSDFFLPINNISEQVIINKINQANESLKKLNQNMVTNNAQVVVFENVEKFVGLSIGKRSIFLHGEDIPINFNIELIKSGGDSYYDTATGKRFITADPASGDKEKEFKADRQISVCRDDFYVTPSLQKGKLYPKIIKFKENNDCKNGIFYYINETNRFVANGHENYFSLHRVKMNMVLYFKNKSGAYGFINSPAELIDIPVSTFDDYKRKIEVQEHIKEYTNTLDGVTLNFNSYSLYGFIEDIQKATLVEATYPWNDKKYEKKILRTMFFLLIHFNNLYTNYDQFSTEFKKFIADPTHMLANIKNFDLVKYDGSTVKLGSDNLIYHYLEKLQKLDERITPLKKYNPNDPNIAKYKEMNDTMIKALNTFESKQIDSKHNVSGENIPYLNKYLKYKEKYLKLKKQLK